MTDAATLTWKLQGTGSGTYVATTGTGQYDRYMIERIEKDPSNGYGAGVEWVVTYPGARTPDSVYNYLGDAKAAAEAWNEIDVELSAEVCSECNGTEVVYDATYGCDCRCGSCYDGDADTFEAALWRATAPRP